eukprot:COSAG01_NODE_72073_length_254_cov_0.658065_1_plen_84_part_11
MQRIENSLGLEREQPLVGSLGERTPPTRDQGEAQDSTRKILESAEKKLFGKEKAAGDLDVRLGAICDKLKMDTGWEPVCEQCKK